MKWTSLSMQIAVVAVLSFVGLQAFGQTYQAVSDLPSVVDEVVEVSEGEEYVGNGTTLPDEFGDTTFSACDDCGMPCGGSCCESPGWYVGAEALFLNRTRASTFKLIEDDNDGENPRGRRRALMTTDALDFNYAWGPRIIFGCYLDCYRRLEFSYYGLHHWNASASMVSLEEPGQGNLTFPIGNNIVDDYDGADYVNINYGSELHNFEANYIVNCCWWVDPLVGFRYMNINERFNYFTLDYASEPSNAEDYRTSNYLINTDNHLVGFQLGGIIDQPITQCLCVDFGFSAGMYVNFANQSTLMRDNDNTEVLRDFNENVGELAFIGDLRLGLTYQMTHCVAATIGYQVTWIDGVALAPEQVSFNSTPNSGNRVNHDGNLFLDGGYAGITIRR